MTARRYTDRVNNENETTIILCSHKTQVLENQTSISGRIIVFGLSIYTSSKITKKNVRGLIRESDVGRLSMVRLYIDAVLIRYNCTYLYRDGIITLYIE